MAQSDSGELLQGTLPLLIRRVLAPGPNHGFAIATRRQPISKEVLKVEEGCRAAGMEVEKARTAARRQFGNPTRIKEQIREIFSFRALEDLAHDISIGVRSIRKSPGFALVAISALTIGVGANIAVFGFVDALLLRPLQASEPGRLIRAYSEGTDPGAFVDYRDYIQYRDRNRSLSNLAMS